MTKPISAVYTHRPTEHVSPRDFLESKLEIFVKKRDLLMHHRYEFIDAEGVMTSHSQFQSQKITIHCRLAFNFHNLDFRAIEKIPGASFNILENLDAFYSKRYATRCIGLVTFQNGIQNTLEDFEKMAQQVKASIQKVGGQPLCIGFYNASVNVLTDLVRLTDSWNLNTRSILSIRQLIFTLAEKFSKYAITTYDSVSAKTTLPPDMLWAHIAHSEGGLLASEVVSSQYLQYLFKNNAYDFMKKHLIVSTYGAVSPVPQTILHTINTYSKDDVTVRFVKQYFKKSPKSRKHIPASERYSLRQDPFESVRLDVCASLDQKEKDHFIDDGEYPYLCKDKCGFKIELVQSLIPNHKLSITAGDHSFCDATYQKALEDNMKKLAGEYRIL